MATFVEPAVYHLAGTRTDADGMKHFLAAFSADDFWTDAPSDTEELIEVAGRRCYNSFTLGDNNPNLTRIREGNAPYLQNILTSGHGSVLEHGSDTYMLLNVSRVCTHELVRHRVGTAFSQESLRYVRLTDISMWLPESLVALPPLTAEAIKAEFLEAMREAEQRYARLGELLNITQRDFAEKKKYTSAMRRVMPIGLATGICLTANHRTWRHTIAMRTSRHAEEEMRLVFNIIADDLTRRYPNLYQDMQETIIDGYRERTFHS